MQIFRVQNNRFNKKELAKFYKVMSLFTSSSVSFTTGIKLMAGKDTNNPQYRLILNNMKSTSSVSESLRNIIPDSDLSFFALSETTGSFHRLLLEINKFNDSKMALNKLAVRSLFTPIILLVLSLSLIAGYSKFVLSEFILVVDYHDWPNLSKAFYNLGDFILSYGFVFILSAICLSLFALSKFLSNYTGEKRLDFLDDLPVFSLYKKHQHCSFFAQYQLACKLGISTDLAIRSIGENAHNDYISSISRKISSRLRQYNVDEAFNIGFFSSFELELISLFSGTDNFSDTICYLYDFTLEEYTAHVTRIISRIQSALLCFVGFIVLWAYLSSNAIILTLD